jgi:hypothetical protein
MLFSRLFRISLFTHTVIACGTALLCMQTQLYLGYSIQNPWLYLFLFFATLLSYNVHFWLASRISNSSEQLDWFRSKQVWIHVLNLSSLLVVLLAGWQVRHLWLALLPALVFNAAYTAPLFFKSELKLPLLFTFIKSYFIGFTWAYVTVILPMDDLQHGFSTQIALLFVHRFLLVSIATLIFDWRDRFRDEQWGVRTPANLFTETQYRYFFLLNVLLYAAVVIQMAVLTGEGLHYLQLLLVPVMWNLFQKANRQTKDSFYLLYVDGLLVLAPLLSLLLLF